MHHQLKILPNYFAAVIRGEKRFEIRDNSDRGFQKGDLVSLQEFDRSIGLTGQYTGEQFQVEITYVTGYEQKPNWVVFGFKNVDEFN